MPRKLIDVSDVWLNRLQTVIPTTIDTLTGIAAQIDAWQIEGTIDPKDLIDTLRSQLIDLKRNMETIKIIF